jgi:DDE superfamily endonuclease
VAAARAAWCDSQGALNPARLIFIDETWIATNMIRGYGRSPRGERLVGAVPYGHWKTMTFVAGLRCDGLTAPFVIDGPINGEWFRTYVEKVLAPTLRPGDVVVLDNLSSQGRKRARDRLGARRQAALPAALFARPQTDRAALRQAQGTPAQGRARTVGAHWTAVATLLTGFSTDECANYFANAGYRRSS